MRTSAATTVRNATTRPIHSHVRVEFERDVVCCRGFGGDVIQVVEAVAHRRRTVIVEVPAGVVLPVELEPRSRRAREVCRHFLAVRSEVHRPDRLPTFPQRHLGQLGPFDTRADVDPRRGAERDRARRSLDRAIETPPWGPPGDREAAQRAGRAVDGQVDGVLRRAHHDAHRPGLAAETAAVHVRQHGDALGQVGRGRRELSAVEGLAVDGGKVHRLERRHDVGQRPWTRVDQGHRGIAADRGGSTPDVPDEQLGTRSAQLDRSPEHPVELLADPRGCHTGGEEPHVHVGGADDVRSIGRGREIREQLGREIAKRLIDHGTEVLEVVATIELGGRRIPTEVVHGMGVGRDDVSMRPLVARHVHGLPHPQHTPRGVVGAEHGRDL